MKTSEMTEMDVPQMQQLPRPSLTPMALRARRYLGDMAIDDRNPDEVVRTKGLQAYRDILNNPYVKAAINARVNAVIGRWEGATPHKAKTPHDTEFVGQITSNGKDRGEEKHALQLARLNVDEWLRKEGWSAILKRALTGAITLGYSVNEILWGYRDQSKKTFPGKWYIRGIEEVLQDYFQFDLMGNLLMQESVWSYKATIPCPQYRFFVVTYDQQYANRYGTSLLRSLVRVEWFERNSWAFWLMFLEKFGSPTILGKVPEGTIDEDKKKLLDVIEMVRNHSGVVIDETQAITLLEATRQGEAGYPVLIEMAHKLYAIVITGNALTLAPSNTGSFAMAANTTAVIREDILFADCEMLDSAVSFQPLYYLTALNFANVEYYPYQRTLPPKVISVTDADLLQRAQRDQLLYQMGVPMPVSYLQKTYRIPEAEAGERLLPPPPSIQNAASQATLAEATATKEGVIPTSASATAQPQNYTAVLRSSHPSRFDRILRSSSRGRDRRRTKK